MLVIHNSAGKDILFKIITAADIANGPMREDFSAPEEFLQIAAIRSPGVATRFAAHAHKHHERKADRTQEAWYVVTGSVEADLYDLNIEHPVARVRLNQGDMVVTYRGGHAYRLSADGVVIEAKNGPYEGREIDKYEIPDGTADASRL